MKNANTVQLSLADTRVGVITQYQLQFTLNVSLDTGANGGQILVTFPVEVVLTGSTYCLASISISGTSISCTVNVTMQQVSVVAPSVQIPVYAG